MSNTTLHLLLNGKETADENEDHLVVDVHDVVPNAEHDCAKLSGKGYDILGIVSFLFFCFPLHDDVPVDGTRLNR